MIIFTYRLLWKGRSCLSEIRTLEKHRLIGRYHTCTNKCKVYLKFAYSICLFMVFMLQQLTGYASPVWAPPHPSTSPQHENNFKSYIMWEVCEKPSPNVLTTTCLLESINELNLYSTADSPCMIVQRQIICNNKNISAMKIFLKTHYFD